MRHARNNDLSDRRKAAADAKSALLNAYRTAKETAEPQLAAKQAERQAIAAAREERRAERERLKTAEEARVRAEAAELQAASDAAARAELEAREMADKERIARVIEDEAARKAKRDQRYAARKARQS